MSRLCKKSKIRKTVKEAAGGIPVTEKASTLIYLDYVLFLQKILQEADMEAARMGDKTITSRHIESCLEKSLKSFRG
ncbi:uncharacterized protein SAPINGB_P002054 [Magnusiomyces paraingens]|uniref:Transcription factor CBF/NF-Y/archaeal histone domain-containing protein n=1 Tax=Magnusiomyces paraingens TaxID=2606893 RepID=A0A5E8BCI2_9ASCO|nr:uncharacterized protein SAPINGB_P002054 [Saprochaete ingens]VVT48999.1 unnamed protein product [Saprochaete ingens]